MTDTAIVAIALNALAWAAQAGATWHRLRSVERAIERLPDYQDRITRIEARCEALHPNLSHRSQP